MTAPDLHRPDYETFMQPVPQPRRLPTIEPAYVVAVAQGQVGNSKLSEPQLKLEKMLREWANI